MLKGLSLSSLNPPPSHRLKVSLGQILLATPPPDRGSVTFDPGVIVF